MTREKQLEKALREVTQTLVWTCFGSCRGYSEQLLTPASAERLAREVLSFPSDKVKIKPLVWMDDFSCIPNHAVSAWSGLCRYTIEIVFVEMNKCVYRLRDHDSFETEEAAKKAAYEYHKQTILSQIEVS